MALHHPLETGIVRLEFSVTILAGLLGMTGKTWFCIGFRSYFYDFWWEKAGVDMSTRGRPLIYPWQPRILGLKPRVFDVKPWVLQKTLRFFKPVANPWFRPPRSIYILIDVLKFFSGKYGSESRIYGQIYMRYMQQIRFGKDPSKSWQEKRSTENPCFPKTQDFHNKTEVL